MDLTFCKAFFGCISYNGRALCDMQPEKSDAGKREAVPGYQRYRERERKRKMKTSYIVIGVIVVVLLFIFFWIRESINEKKGMDSADKQAIRDIVNKLVPDAGEYMAAYAYWELKNWGGGGRSITTTTRYWYYAVAFKPGTIYVIPLSYSGSAVSHGDPICLNKENLGMVNAKAGESWASFYDLERKEIVSLAVAYYNTRSDKYHPVNIQQKEEQQAFAAFVRDFMAEVNSYRQVTVTGKLLQPLG